MKKETIVNLLRAEKQQLHERFHIIELGLFGPYVRGEQTDASEVDILVEFAGNINLFNLVDMENYLALRLNHNVNVVIKRGLRLSISKQVLQEVVYL